MWRELQLRKGGHNAGADLEKLCEPVSHMEMPLMLSGFPESFLFFKKSFLIPITKKAYHPSSKA